MAMNFKTKKGFIEHVSTTQGNGYVQGMKAKRDSNGIFYMEKGKYTTCDAEHPHFYLALSRMKVRPAKDVVFGPAYLVVEDVPLPLAIPYGFFPFNKKYSELWRRDDTRLLPARWRLLFCHQRLCRSQVAW